MLFLARMWRLFSSSLLNDRSDLCVTKMRSVTSGVDIGQQPEPSRWIELLRSLMSSTQNLQSINGSFAIKDVKDVEVITTLSAITVHIWKIFISIISVLVPEASSTKIRLRISDKPSQLTENLLDVGSFSLLEGLTVASIGIVSCAGFLRWGNSNESGYAIGATFLRKLQEDWFMTMIWKRNGPGNPHCFWCKTIQGWFIRKLLFAWLAVKEFCAGIANRR